MEFDDDNILSTELEHVSFLIDLLSHSIRFMAMQTKLFFLLFNQMYQIQL